MNATTVSIALCMSELTNEGPTRALERFKQVLLKAVTARGRLQALLTDPHLRRASFNDLLARSSLGSPGAIRVRERTPPEVAADIVKRAERL